MKNTVTAKQRRRMNDRPRPIRSFFRQALPCVRSAGEGNGILLLCLDFVFMSHITFCCMFIPRPAFVQGLVVAGIKHHDKKKGHPSLPSPPLWSLPYGPSSPPLLTSSTTSLEPLPEDFLGLSEEEDPAEAPPAAAEAAAAAEEEAAPASCFTVRRANTRRSEVSPPTRRFRKLGCFVSCVWHMLSVSQCMVFRRNDLEVPP